MKRVIKSIIFAVVLVALVGLSAGMSYFHFWVKPEMIRGFIAKAAPPPTTVAATVARKESWMPGLSATGSVRAFQGIDISSQLGGIVSAIHIGSGQEVPKSAPLFDLDTSVERADLRSGQAVLKNSEVALQRQQQLVAGGNTSRANVDTAVAARDQAAATVERVKATIAQKTVVAPFQGRLGIREVDVGQYASPGMSLITLQQLDPIFVDFPVPEQYLGLLKVDQTVNVKVDAYPNKTFAGKIALIDARIQAESRAVNVRAVFDNPDRKLLPGMFTNVSVRTGEPQDVVVLPRTAVTFSLYGDSVFVLEPKQDEPKAGSAQAAPSQKVFTAVRRFVRTGDSKDELVVVLEGVKAGETVITEGQIKLQNNALVAVDPKAALTPPTVRPKE